MQLLRENSVLGWYNCKRVRLLYPKLRRVALRVLVAPATEIPSERSLSAANLIDNQLSQAMTTTLLARRLHVYMNHPVLKARRIERYRALMSDAFDDAEDLARSGEAEVFNSPS